MTDRKTPFDDDCCVSPAANDAATRYAAASHDLARLRAELPDDQKRDLDARTAAVRAEVDGLLDLYEWRVHPTVRVQRVATPEGGAFAVDLSLSLTDQRPGYRMAEASAHVARACMSDDDLYGTVGIFLLLAQALMVVTAKEEEADRDDE